MKIKETKLRELYKKETGIKYHVIPMKYIVWKRLKIKKLQEKFNRIYIIIDSPEAYVPGKAIQISYSQAIWK